MNRKTINPSAISSGVFYTEYAEATITTNTNNLIVADLSSFVLVELTSTGNFNITGLVPPDITIGYVVKIFNAGTNNITLKNNDAGSTAENRFLIGSDKLIQPNEGYELTYRVLKSRWGSTGSNI